MECFDVLFVVCMECFDVGSSLQDRDGRSVCVALSPPSQHAEGKYMVINIHDGGKVYYKNNQ